jgi:hypothetical protein
LVADIQSKKKCAEKCRKWFAKGWERVQIAERTGKVISMKIPDKFKAIYTEIVVMTDAFCERYLNEDYRQLCQEMAAVLCLAELPVGKGKPVGWASGIVHAVGWVNFLHDSSQSPHMTSAQVAEGFGVSQGTMMAKSKFIRDELDLIQMDPDWCLPALLEDNPLVWMLKVNGFIMDIRMAPREAQEEAYRQGLIPFIPADRQKPEPLPRTETKIIKFPHSC